MQIENVYRPRPVICQRTDSLAKAARRMHAGQVGALAVCDNGRLDQLVGILSERDIVQAVADSTDIGHNTGSRLRVLWCTHSHPQEDTAVIADRMLNLEIRHIPVTRDGTVLVVAARSFHGSLLPIGGLSQPHAWFAISIGPNDPRARPVCQSPS